MFVQFGNNWIQQPIWTWPAASSNFGCPLNFFHPIISKLDSMQSYYMYKLTVTFFTTCLDKIMARK